MSNNDTDDIEFDFGTGGADTALENQLQASLNIYDNPVVKDLMRQVSALTEKVSEFERLLPQFNEKQKELDTEKDKLMAEYQARLDTLNRERNNIMAAKADIETQIWQIKDTQSALKKQLDGTIDELKASQAMNELNKKWEAVLGSAEWREFIFPYQMIGAKFMASKNKCLNADQMGLGKTLQTLAAIQLTDGDFAETGPDRAVLWLTKKSLMYTTAREIQRWLPGRKFIVAEGSPQAKEFICELGYQDGAICIVNYDSLQLRASKNKEASQSKILGLKWQRVVTDEAHRYKNDGTHFFKNVKKAASSAKQFYALTGTPIQNRPDEFWAILNMILPDRFPSKYRFINEYCSQYGYQGSQVEFRYGAFDRLISNVKDYVIRRRKDEVELELPDVLQDDRYVDLGPEQRKLYEDMRDKFAVWLDSQQEDFIQATNVLAHFTRLAQIAQYPQGIEIDQGDGTKKKIDIEESAKFDECMELVEELLESDERVVIFSTYNAILNRIAVELKKKGVAAKVITGGTTAQAVDDAISEYNDGRIMVLLSNVRGGLGEGQNLQAGSHVIFLGQWWNPAVNNQCWNRLHRPGQKKNVEVHIIHATDTIDAYIQEKLNQKMDMFSAVFERQELRKAIDEGLI